MIRAHAQGRGAHEFTGQQVLLEIALIGTSGAWEPPCTTSDLKGQKHVLRQ